MTTRMLVRWSEIEAECGDFRTGFVSTFRKYEGQPTDEKDGQGRTVKVTASSFARHMGIADRTFRDWKKQDGGHRGLEHLPTRDTRGAKKALRDPEQRSRVIADLNSEERAEVVREISKASAAPEPVEPQRNLRRELDEAVAVDLSAQVAKLIAGASRIDLLLAERGAEFQRIDSEAAARMDADLERVLKTIRDVRAELLKHREIEVAS